MTDLLHRNDKSVTVHNKLSKIPPSTTMHFVPPCEDRMLFLWVYFCVSLCRQQHPKCKQAIRLVYAPFFCKLRSSSKSLKQKSKGVVLEISTAPSSSAFRIIRHMFTCNFFLTISDIITPPDYWPSHLNHPV